MEDATSTQPHQQISRAGFLGASSSRQAGAFAVWAPFAQKVDVHLIAPEERLIPMNAVDNGYWEASDAGIKPGALYFYRLDGMLDRPDPASRSNPQGVQGPSAVVDLDFPWEDHQWRGLPIQEYILYELHIGTFTQEGTFDAVILELPYLKRLGVTAIELMPVAQFPGDRNWGYDGVLPFAVQSTYGGLDGLRRLVNACHQHGLAVVLDVVYNHLGPEGNCLRDFGPYFTARYRTPWGEALNFDGEYSDEVRRYFIENALYWVRDCHVDGLRLDAVHAIADNAPLTFLEEITAAVHNEAARLGRQVQVMAECADNNARLVRPVAAGGYGLDSQWSEDLHHALHVALTGETDGYYQDYTGVTDLARVYTDGFAFAGRYSSYRKRRHGSPTKGIPARSFIVFSQNHDQVGNRMLGERLTRLVTFEALKLAAAAVLLSPFIPLLFMGEEYGEEAPFQYFISHTHPDLVRAVRDGRAREFASFAWLGEPPDPQEEAALIRSRPDLGVRTHGRHTLLLSYYTELIRLRRTIPALSHVSKDNVEAAATEQPPVLLLRRTAGASATALLFNFADKDIVLASPALDGTWKKVLDSADPQWGGPGRKAPDRLESGITSYVGLQAQNVTLYLKESS